MSIKALLLHPRDARAGLPSVEPLGAQLRAIGLIGERSVYFPDDLLFHAGPRFLEWVTFDSSHRVIELVSDGQGGLQHGPVHDSRTQCTIEFCYGAEARPLPLVSCITDPPRCRACGYRHEEPQWLDLVGQWWDARGDCRVACPGCGASAALPELDWNHTAGFATDYLQIRQIQPREARPSAALLDILRERLGTAFDYCYYWL
jgi:hypothetical protein